MGFRTEMISRRGGRASNQDFCDFINLREGACWAVADGLGGHLGGEQASRLAVATILDSFRRNPEFSAGALGRHLLAANGAIVRRQRSEPALRQMRTTAVVLISDYRSVLWAHVGDSRLYYFQNGRVVAQTRDHSVPQILADAGDIAADQIRGHEDKNRLLRALGSEEEPKPTILSHPQRLYRGDA
ncbi:MAG TPA: protein phosphatase 2C domain-containing protein, partial [Blastocatellia bacterium]